MEVRRRDSKITGLKPSDLRALEMKIVENKCFQGYIEVDF